MLDFIFKAVPVDSIPDGIFPKRQVVGTAIVTTVTAGTTVTISSVLPSTTSIMSSSPAQSTTTPLPISSTPIISSTTPVPSSQPPVISSTTTSIAPVSSTPAAPSSTSRPSSIPVSTSSVVVVDSSTINRSTLSSRTTITTALIGSATEAVESTSYWTSNGQVYSTVFTSQRIVSSTTGFATTTIDPLLATNDPSSSGSLSPHSQAIIGGVVGGVGGAILLGGLAFAAWRLRSKRQREKLPQDDYYEGKYGTLATEESSNGLERYRTDGGGTHPATSVNASSNF